MKERKTTVIGYYFDIIISTTLLLVSMLPSVYLRYLPFRSVLDAHKRKYLLHGYAIIFFLELTGALFLLYNGIIPYNFQTFKIIWIFFGYIPYFILNLILIRPYVAQHFFILGIQQILAGTLSTFAVTITLFVAGEDDFFHHFKLYSIIYLTLYLSSFPLVLPFFRQIFLRFASISTDRFWHYISPLPLLIIVHESFYSLGDKVLNPHYFLPRLIFFSSGIFIALTAWRGLEYILTQAATTERSLALLRRINSFRAYTRSMQDKQARLAIVRHDLRHNIKMLAGLISRGEDEAAMQLISSLSYQIDATRVEHFSTNPLINAALSVYIQQARKKNIPIDIKIDLPDSFAAEIDLSLVLCNLLENAIQAEEREEEQQRGIRVRGRTLKDSIFLSVENRCAHVIRLSADGLPKRSSNIGEHGYGIRSVLLFAKKHGVEYYVDQKNGWFSLLLHLPLPKSTDNNL